MKTIRKPRHNPAFGILEALLSVTVIGIFAGAAVVLVNGAAANAKERKLELDVATINSALSMFVANGGDLTGANTAAEVIARLKTRVADSQADELVGVNTGFLDPRVTPVTQSTAQAATSQARVLWDATKERFIVRHSGAVGYVEFVLDESKAGDEDPQYERRLLVEYSKGDGKWVWDYAEHNTTNAGPSILPPIGTLTQAGTPGTSSGLQLNPPNVSVPGDTYPLVDYDGLEVTLTDPNPPGASELFYSVLPGIWERYVGPVAIDPGTNLETQAVTVDPENWANSVTTLDEYRTTPPQLDLAVAFASSVYDYVGLGGALEPGSYPQPTLVQPGAASLANGAAIPSQYLNSSVFDLHWTFDGADPRTALRTISGDAFSGGTISGDAFSGSFGEEIPVTIDDWGSGDTLKVKVYAKSYNAEIVTDSELVSETLTATKMELRPPVVALNPSGTEPPVYDVTISLPTDDGDTPLGARIFYTTDGSDPGFDAGGEPAGGTLYAGTFQVPAGGVVSARVFPPALYSQWFIPSAPTTESAPRPAPPDIFVNFCGSGLSEYAVTVFDGGQFKLSHEDSGVFGRVAIAPGATWNISDGGVTSDFVIHEGNTGSGGDTLPGPGGVPLSPVTQDLSALRQQALIVSAEAAALPATQTFGKIDSAMSIEASAPDGLNVISIDEVSLSNGDILTISGGADDYFVLNIASKVSMSGGSTWALSGGLAPSSVIINMLPSSGTFNGSGGSAVLTGGIILAPHSSNRVDITGTSQISGAILVGGEFSASGGAQVVGNACGSNFAPPAPAIPAFPTNAILSQDSVSRLYSVQVDAATSQGSYAPISGPNAQLQRYNAVGYRSADGMLYGMNPQLGQLLKVDPATGDASVVASLGITSAYAGDFNTDNGLYYFKRSSESKLYVVDVDAGAVVQQIDITPTVGSIGDIAYNAADGKFYSYLNKQLYAIDPTTGVRTVHPAHAENPDGHAGASFADGGNVFIALNTGGLYWLDTSDGSAHWIADSPSSSLNDGALLGSGGAASGGGTEPPTGVLSESFEADSPGIWSNGFFAWESEDDFSNSDHSQIPEAGSQYAAVYTPGGLTQATVDLPDFLTGSQQAAVAGGVGVWEFSAWLAGWDYDSSVVALSVEWFDGLAGTGSSLGTSILADGSSAANVVAVVNGSVLEGDATNWNVDNWSQYVTSGSVPAGALSFVLSYAVNPGGDGYIDKLSFSISGPQ